MPNGMSLVSEVWAYNENDCRSAVKVLFNGCELFDMIDGEPEDNNLSRNFSFDLSELVNRVALAAMDGEVVRHETKEVSWDEFFNE
jgi:hypothetical protein